MEQVYQAYSAPLPVTGFLKIVWNTHTCSQTLQKKTCMCMCIGVVQMQLLDNNNQS